jgi:hypothetical protein
MGETTIIENGNAMTELTKIEPPAAPVIPVDPMLGMIQHVVTGGGNVEQLRELLALKREHDADQARKAFHAAFAAAQAEIPTVIKNRENKHTKSTYADLAAIEQAVMPVVARRGLSVRFYPVRSELSGHYGVDCVVSHQMGHSETYHADVPADGAGMQGSANKTATHAFGSTMTYGRRYLLCMIFNIATGDDDDGNNAGNPQPNITEAQYIELQGLIERSGLAEKVVLDAERIAALHFLPSNRFDVVRSKLLKNIQGRAQ